MYLSEQKYVDLGLGNHRVKCRVHDDFKYVQQRIIFVYQDMIFPFPWLSSI